MFTDTKTIPKRWFNGIGYATQVFFCEETTRQKIRNIASSCGIFFVEREIFRIFALLDPPISLFFENFVRTGVISRPKTDGFLTDPLNFNPEPSIRVRDI